jgi:hypothetical protein
VQAIEYLTQWGHQEHVIWYFAPYSTLSQS